MRKSILVASVLLSTLVTGCGLSTKDPILGGKGVLSSLNSSAPLKSSNILEDSPSVVNQRGLSRLTTKPAPDYSKYTGSWGVVGNSASGTALNVSIQANNIHGLLSSINSEDGSVADISFKGAIQENIFTYQFENDGWNHSGKLTLDFRGKTIGVSVELTNPSNGQRWGITQGTFELEQLTNDPTIENTEPSNKPSPIPQDTSSQEGVSTYTNTTLEYSFNHPTIFSIDSQAPSGTDGVTLYTASKEAMLIVQAHPTDKQLDIILREEMDKHKTILSVDGQANYFIISWQDEGMMGNTKILLENGTLYLIQLDYPSFSENVYQPHFKTVIDSFKTILDKKI